MTSATQATGAPAGTDPLDDAPSPVRGRAGRRGPALALCVAGYVVLALLSDPSVWLHGPTTHLLEAGNGDVSEGVWYLAQTPYAVLHGANPFANNWLHYPSGVNLVDNTGQLLLGALAAPFTFVWGAVLAYNLVMVAAAAGSATAAFFVVRRWTAWLPAAFIGGLVYGFSPYMVGQGNGHPFLVAVPIPPLVLLMMDRIVVRRTGVAWRNGLVLGVLLVAQLYISAEVLASTVVVTACGVVVVLAAQLVARRRRAAAPAGASDAATAPGPDWGYLVKAGAVAAALLVVFAAYPLWVAVDGPAHIVGPAQSVDLIEGLSSDVLTPIVPTVNQHFSFGLAWTGTKMVAEHGATLFPDGAENGGYLGIPLIVGLVAGVVALRRRRVVRLAAVMAVVSLVLSMGSDLHFDGRYTGVRLPFDVLAHLPFFNSEVASRYSLYVWLFVALLVAVILDAVHTEVRRRRGEVPAVLASVALAAAALFPLVPAWPYGSGRAAVPAWYESAYVGRVPVGSTLLSYPFPSVGNPSAMLWQAEAKMRFRMPGGYVISPGPGKVATFSPPSTVISNAFFECTAGIPQPPVTKEMARQVRQNLRAWRVDTVVVPRNQRAWRCAARFLQGTLGPPVSEAGSDVWASLWSKPWMADR
jgi:hypothetical protein